MKTNLHQFNLKFSDQELSLFWYVLSRRWRIGTTVTFTLHPLGVKGQRWTDTDYKIVLETWERAGKPMPDFSRAIIE